MTARCPVTPAATRCRPARPQVGGRGSAAMAVDDDVVTAQPVWLLVVVSLALALVVAAGSRLAVGRIVPAGEADNVHAIAAPLMPALGRDVRRAHRPDPVE